MAKNLRQARRRKGREKREHQRGSEDGRALPLIWAPDAGPAPLARPRLTARDSSVARLFHRTRVPCSLFIICFALLFAWLGLPLLLPFLLSPQCSKMEVFNALQM